ncbi:methyltransferase domain-containing protein [Rhodovastum atsumiense]|uniref:Methyltransferase domain-containing protein n=1 Tax=Rhodovastum atsumiense TaxID=504468 RepID=A0A5M6IQR3_9PROT|nr:methyltransferase domain-containing protein [Rhodovastum atsumiense]KAA5610229.1 methyltransferase domain-containing protein [Rhodovastum atsumiense]
MLPYPDVPNPDLLDRIPLDARAVLDVGCATGALGAEYKRRNPACRFLGIELDVDAARLAATRLDQVAIGDVEADPFPFGTGPFDCIIYGDVLEHLRDPWSVLTRQAEALSPDGVVLICMPNAEHWSFVERLLRGTWDYEETGLFDRTHLRWFTRAATRRAVLGAGLLPVEVAPRIFDAAASEEFVRDAAPALVALGIDVTAYRERAQPLQHVWRAARRVPAPLHVCSTMLEHVGGVSHVRVTQPLQALTSIPGVTTEVLAPGAPTPKGDDADSARIFIFHRPVLAGETGLATLRSLIAEGWLVLCEFDDHPDFLPAMQHESILSFRGVHAVQTSTDPLAAVLRSHNPEVAVFPNAIARLPAVRNYTDPNRLTLFFAGINREEEWPQFLPGLNAAAALAGERLQFRILADRGLFDALQTPHKTFTPLCNYDTYLDLLSQSELSFMPLRDNAFNRCKSDLKFIEAAAHRVTAIATPTVYADSIEDGRTGLLVQDAADLQKCLLHLLATPSQGRTLADSARAMVARRRMLAAQASRRHAWYRSLWERREELTAALLDRVPELR